MVKEMALEISKPPRHTEKNLPYFASVKTIQLLYQCFIRHVNYMLFQVCDSPCTLYIRGVITFDPFATFVRRFKILILISDDDMIRYDSKFSE